jgi:hypothetical protein
MTAPEKVRDAVLYYNSLPDEQRAQLAPLLEEYRLRGMHECAMEFAGAARKIDTRIKAILNGEIMR